MVFFWLNVTIFSFNIKESDSKPLMTMMHGHFGIHPGGIQPGTDIGYTQVHAPQNKNDTQNNNKSGYEPGEFTSHPGTHKLAEYGKGKEQGDGAQSKKCHIQSAI